MINPYSSWDRYITVQQFAGSEGHCMGSQPLEEAGWLAEMSLLSRDFQGRRKAPAPNPRYHLLCNISARGVLAKQVRSCPCFARTFACMLQKRYKGGGGVHHGPLLSFRCHCTPVVPLCLMISCWHSFQPSAWIVEACSSSISVVFCQELPTQL